MIGCCFKVSVNDLKFEKKSKKKKNDSPVSGTPGSNFLLVSGILGSFDSRCPGYRGVLTPGVPDTGEFWLPGVPDTGGVSNPRCPGHRGVVFWQFTDFFKLQAIATAFKAIIYQKSLWIFHLLYKYIYLVHYFKNFLNILFFLWLPVSRMLGSLLKMYITLRKFAKNENGSRTSLVGPEG